MFLQILGAIFLIILAVAAFFGWKAWRLIKGKVDSDLPLAMSVLPSLQLELQPSTADEWQDKDRLAYTEGRLKRVGAHHVGYYWMQHGMATIRISLWDFRQQAVAALYEAEAEGVDGKGMFVQEVACRLDGGSLCITSNPHALYDPRPANHVLRHNAAEDIVELIKALRPAIPEGRKLLKISDALEFFTEGYEDTSEWRWRKAQLMDEKTQQVLTAVGVKITDELMQQLIEYGADYSVEVAVKQARRKLARNPKLSAQQWEKMRDRLVIVNQRMQLDHVVDAIYAAAGELDDRQQQVLDGFCLTARELVDPIAAFQMLAQSMDLKIKRIASMEQPVRSEVYLPL